MRLRSFFLSPRVTGGFHWNMSDKIFLSSPKVIITEYGTAVV